VRTIITDNPFVDRSRYFYESPTTPAKWVGHPDVRGEQPAVVAYRLRFDLDAPQTIRVHVTADERYELFVDGRRVGRGSERGDRANWFFETYDLDLAAGGHVIVARTWFLGDAGPSL
jgi:alpha-L-rhamnosidase